LPVIFLTDFCGSLSFSNQDFGFDMV
jgi:hypothetical protein